MNIVCDAPIKLAFTTTDNRHNSISEDVGDTMAGFNLDQSHMFGLGSSGSKIIGTYIIKFGNALTGAKATADGAVIDTVYSQDRGASWGELGSVWAVS